ncbi:MAG: efflux RND transporter periplasmic adaptor subunit [Muribaculaceae bacterium]|nr:efflux RND transporter periplasmic adaptor subunit [Muribaculaceae bacterium]
MKKFNIRLASYSIGILALLFAPSCKSEAEDEHHHHHGHEHPSHAAHHDHDHDSDAEEESDEITLSPEMADRFGVVCDTVSLGDFVEVIHAPARVLATGAEVATVAAPTSGIVSYSRSALPGREVSRGTSLASIRSGAVTGGNPNLAAKAALDAASRELERLKPLYEERLVTASEYNAAVAAYESARAAYSSAAASGAATAPISGVILSIDATEGSFVEVGTPLATIATDRNLTVRLDVPRSFGRRLADFTDARLDLGDGSSMLLSSLGGKRVGAATSPAATSASAYIPVFFSVPNTDGALSSGAGFDAWLLGANRPGVIAVPVTALSEQMGEYFVYERLDDECYRKLPVRLGSSDGARVEILEGLQTGQVIVFKGATTLRLSENAKAIPEGHSHNH